MKNKKYTTAVFDLDGTLLDTLEDLTDSVNYMLCENNMPMRSIDEIRTFVGNGLVNLIQRALPQNTDENKFNEYFVQFKTHYSMNSRNNTAPYDGVYDVLKTLKSNGIRIAVVSNKAHDQTSLLCNEMFGNSIDYAIGQSDGIRQKPAPDSVFEVLSKLESDKSKALYIGDSEVDVQTAANSGLDFVGVSWGFRGRKKLEDLGCENIADEASELLKYFNI